jgi:hypothetical protein
VLQTECSQFACGQALINGVGGFAHRCSIWD